MILCFHLLFFLLHQKSKVNLSSQVTEVHLSLMNSLKEIECFDVKSHCDNVVMSIIDQCRDPVLIVAKIRISYFIISKSIQAIRSTTILEIYRIPYQWDQWNTMKANLWYNVLHLPLAVIWSSHCRFTFSYHTKSIDRVRKNAQLKTRDYKHSFVLDIYLRLFF